MMQTLGKTLCFPRYATHLPRWLQLRNLMMPAPLGQTSSGDMGKQVIPPLRETAPQGIP
jgi:hypothetical protein